MTKYLVLLFALCAVGCSGKKLIPQTNKAITVPKVAQYSKNDICLCGQLVISNDGVAFINNKVAGVLSTNGQTEFEYLPTVAKPFTVQNLEQLLKYVEEPPHSLCLLGDVHPLGKYNVITFIKELYKHGTGCWNAREALLCGPTHHGCFQQNL